MRRLAVLFALVIAMALFAAIPAQAKPKKPAAGKAAMAQQTLDWSGFYAGFSAGGVQGGSLEHLPTGPAFYNAFYPSSGPSQLVGSIGDEGNALIAGFHIGYLNQRGNLVFGYEADFNYLDIDRSYHDVRTLGAGLNGTFEKRLNYEVEWMATLRGRLGLAVDRALIYGTGGLAFASINADSYVRFSNGGDVYTTSEKNLRTGWTAGAGLDYALAGNWLVRTEYLYVDLGKTSTDTNTAVGAGGDLFYYTATTDNRFHIVRFGLSYKFN